MGEFKISDKSKAPGLQAIAKACKNLYPGEKQPFEHFNVLVPWRMGGNDPLDIIDIFDAGDYYHFVTYGLTELYEKETKDPEYSGFGFELTVKLKKEFIKKDEEAELRCMAGILQAIARMSYEHGEIFGPNEFIYSGSTKGLNLDKNSLITGFVMKEDALGTIETKHGKVQFVQLVGATDRELCAIRDGKISVEKLLQTLKDDVTDYSRKSML